MLAIFPYLLSKFLYHFSLDSKKIFFLFYRLLGSFQLRVLDQQILDLLLELPNLDCNFVLFSFAYFPYFIYGCVCVILRLYVIVLDEPFKLRNHYFGELLVG